MQGFADMICFPANVRRLTRCNIARGDYNCYVVKLLANLHSLLVKCTESVSYARWDILAPLMLYGLWAPIGKRKPVHCSMNSRIVADKLRLSCTRM